MLVVILGKFHCFTASLPQAAGEGEGGGNAKDGEWARHGGMNDMFNAVLRATDWIATRIMDDRAA